MDIAAAFIERSRHYLAFEYPTKIRRCLDALPSESIWLRSDGDSNSIGNLLLHLEGNVRQWIVSRVGGAPDARQRAAEFHATDGADADTLFASLRRTLDQADAVIGALDQGELATHRLIQGRDVTVFEAVYHVVEHFSLHTGQIILLTKRYAPGSIAFYEDAGGLAVPVWRNPRSEP
ncbi:MAG: DinB family protein [bacterium]